MVLLYHLKHKLHLLVEKNNNIQVYKFSLATIGSVLCTCITIRFTNYTNVINSRLIVLNLRYIIITTIKCKIMNTVKLLLVHCDKGDYNMVIVSIVDQLRIIALNGAFPTYICIVITDLQKLFNPHQGYSNHSHAYKS